MKLNPDSHQDSHPATIWYKYLWIISRSCQNKIRKKKCSNKDKGQYNQPNQYRYMEGAWCIESTNKTRIFSSDNLYKCDILWAANHLLYVLHFRLHPGQDAFLIWLVSDIVVQQQWFPSSRFIWWKLKLLNSDLSEPLQLQGAHAGSYS